MKVTSIDLPMDKIAEFCDHRRCGFAVRWQVVEFALFGSVLREDFLPDSNIDVMVQFDPEARPTLFDFVYMEEELKAIFDRDVDLVTRKGIENSRNYLRRKAILSSARVIYGTGYSVLERGEPMSENEKNITVFSPDGSQKTIVVKPGMKGLTNWERVNAMTEEEIARRRRAEGDRNARSDLDALPIEDNTMWERGKIVYPRTSSELPI